MRQVSLKMSLSMLTLQQKAPSTTGQRSLRKDLSNLNTYNLHL